MVEEESCRGGNRRYCRLVTGRACGRAFKTHGGATISARKKAEGKGFIRLNCLFIKPLPCPEAFSARRHYFFLSQGIVLYVRHLYCTAVADVPRSSRFLFGLSRNSTDICTHILFSLHTQASVLTLSFVTLID